MVTLWLSLHETSFSPDVPPPNVVCKLVNDVNEAVQMISLRETIFSNIVTCYGAGTQDEFKLTETIERTISVVYGRNNRPAIFFAKVSAESQAIVTMISTDGLSKTSEESSLPALLKDVSESPSSPPQPTDYMQQRNILSEPTWLVDTIGNCFEDLEEGERFPEPLSNEAELRHLLHQRSFHSPSLTDQQALWAIFFIFEELNLFSELGINEDLFKDFLLVIRKNYKPNPYHNFHHAVDVLQFAFLLLKSSPGLIRSLSSMDIFSILVAAIGHDVGHTSYNNRFHCQAETLLSVLFHDQSVLENYHSLIIFSILRHPRYNFCSSWDTERWRLFRRIVISCVLGTDMSAHFKYIKNFSDAQLQSGRELDQEGRILLSVLVIKCADISNIIRPFEVARRWGFKLVSEFFCQGDWERFLGQTPCLLTDRFTYDLARSQEHFMLQVAGPLFRFTAEAFPGTEFCIEALESNVQSWRVWVPEADEIVQASEDLRPYIKTKP